MDLTGGTTSGLRPQRPFWSVMIPTYNSLEYLEETLRSVLSQDPGEGEMQIEVLEDCSPSDPAELVRRVAGDRVRVWRQPKNLGLAGNWNSCIERARGEWVHILHGDDLVHPGFYLRLRRGIENRPEIGAAFCRHYFIDGPGKITALSALERADAGVLGGSWLERLAVGQRVQCPSAVVRKATYERVGGFRGDLHYTLDWEMWLRIASNGPWWFEPEPLASYRSHEHNETARLAHSCEMVKDCLRALEIVKAYLPASEAPRLLEGARMNLLMACLHRTAGALDRRDFQTALAQSRSALMYCPKRWVVRKLLELWGRWIWAFCFSNKRLLAGGNHSDKRV